MKQRQNDEYEKNGEPEEELISTRRKRQNNKNKNVKRKIRESGDADKESVSSQRINIDLGEGEEKVNRYYLSVAKRYRVAGVVAAFALIAFLFTMLVFYRSSITYSNLMYLIRDLNSENPIVMDAYADVTYDEVYSASFAMYKSRITVVSSTGIAMYSSTGQTELSDDFSYADPAMDTGEKYALVFDRGANSYCIYTVLSRVLSAKTDEIIEDGCVGENGYYALLTRSDDSKFLVTVYDESFRALTNYYKDKYVTDIALRADGREIAIVSATVDASDISGEVMLGKVGSEESESLTLKGQLPLYCRYAENGVLWVLTDKALVAVENGDIKWQNTFTAMTPSVFDTKSNVFAVACSKNAIGSENEIFVFDTDGKVLYNDLLDKKLSYIVTDGEYTVYTVGEGVARRVIYSDGSAEDEIATEEINTRVTGAVAAPANLIICSPGGTASLFAGK